MPEIDHNEEPLHKQAEWIDLDGWMIPRSEIRSKSKSDLAYEYGKCTKTIKQWLERAGIRSGNRNDLMPSELMKFYNHVGPNERFAPPRNKRKEARK